MRLPFPQEDHVKLFHFVTPTLFAAGFMMASHAAATPLGNPSNATGPAFLRIEHNHSDEGYGGRDERDNGSRRDQGKAADDDDRLDRAHRGGNGHGASFTIRSGDVQLETKCPSGESSRACADASLMLLDRLKAIQSQSMTSAPTAPSR